MDIKHGEFLVKTARKVVETAVKGEKFEVKAGEEWLNKKSGIFVTLQKYPSNALRGCIGFIEPVFPLLKALEKAAKASALQDTRFEPVKEKELDKLTVEVSILTEPEEYLGKRDELPLKIEIGKHGLVAEMGMFKGLLLPQVATEYNWDAEEFLSQTCIKAGLPPLSWKDSRVTIYTFESIIFREKKPSGEVEQPSSARNTKEK